MTPAGSRGPTGTTRLAGHVDLRPAVGRGTGQVPEGHTIHRLARDHKRLFAGRVLRVTSPQGRFAEGAALLDGRVLERLDPYGKHLFYGFGAGRWLHVHLGLYGKWATGALPAPTPRGALRLRLQGDDRWADLRGPTACELVTPAEKRGIEARLGPDPLATGRRADPTPLLERVGRSRTAVGALLMDQSVLAGVGNVYRAELLFRHGLDPLLPGRDLPGSVVEAMWWDLRRLMQAGVRSGRIVTTRPEHRPHRSGPARADERTYVYRRTGEPCRLCGTTVLTALMVGRNLFWCPSCQGGLGPPTVPLGAAEQALP